MAKPLLLAALHGAFVLIVLVHGQDQQGFISIDCGAPNNYTDERTGITYTTDDNYIDTGVSSSISPIYNTTFLQSKFSNVRSFPEETKNCYTLRPSHGYNHSYLIRASFMYGNYDGTSQSPEFDLYIGVNKWTTVELTDSSNITTFEIIHVLQSDYLHVCLVNTNSGTPFISVLELRILNDGTYVTQSGSLELVARLDCGLSPNRVVRYKDDFLDRIWMPLNANGWQLVNTSLGIGSNNFVQPWVVMSTALTPMNASDTAMEVVNWRNEGNMTNELYIYMHFAELIELQDNQTREFNIYINDRPWYGPLAPRYLKTDTIYSSRATVGSYFQVWINKTENSTLPPLLNAFEVYSVKHLLFSQTHQNDVDAIMNIKSMYGLKRNWQGDPCAPKIYIWNGLNCSYKEANNDFDDPPRIISLNLSSSGLSGEITPNIFDLKLLQILDLSNNNLSGPVPEFLSQLPSLKVLNLQRNNLSGTLPIELYEKSNNGSISLSLDENSNLCLTNPCEKKKKKDSKVVIPVVASIGGFVVLLLAAAAIFWGFKRRKQAGTTATKVNVESNNGKESVELEIKNKQLTYSEVVSITNNFERVIGRGGFGTVYHGHLNDTTQVAVKMLSPSSAQGFKQFHAEAKLLTRVYHRNLTSLVGYCDEGPNMGLVYEYMSNGDLAWHLSDKNPHPLNWEVRLKIATDAAQGLEYLHNGCKPPIIHRDVKSTNMLLNEKLDAKLADFGLSRAFPAEGDHTHVSTRVVGTQGYLDPEYYLSNRLTEKSDVFSFGVVMLEIITGRHAISKNNDINHWKCHIIEWVKSMLSEGDIENIVDPRLLLEQDLDKNSVWKAVELAMACVSLSSIKRPTMTRVVVELKQCLAMEMARTMNMNSEVSEISELPEN